MVKAEKTNNINNNNNKKQQPQQPLVFAMNSNIVISVAQLNALDHALMQLHVTVMYFDQFLASFQFQIQRQPIGGIVPICNQLAP